MTLATLSAVAPAPWKNGGGVTRELLRLPASGADGWTLRISVADIAADGPFSPFTGVTRWFAVIAGAGVRLRWPARALDLRPGDPPFCFEGDDAPDCMLLAGPTRDLNVMVRRDAGQARVHAASFHEEASPGAAGLGFFALRPLNLHGASAAPIGMPALSLAWFEPSGASPLEPASACWVVPRDEVADPLHAGSLAGYWIHLDASASPAR